MHTNRCFITFAFATLASAASLLADPITLINPSFESSLGYNGGDTGTIPGWTATNGGTYGQTESNVVNAFFTSGVSGNNVIYVGGGISQNTSKTFVAGVTYTLTVDAGRPVGTNIAQNTGFIFGFRNGTSANSGFYPLYAGSVFIGTFSTPGTLQTYTVTYTATAADAGKAISIGLYDYFSANLYKVDNFILNNDTNTTPLQTWRYTYFGTKESTGNAADLADPDGDGIVNLLEYALNGNPLVRSSAPLPTAAVVSGKLTLNFLRARSDLTYIVQGTSDLSSGWTDLATNPGAISTTMPTTFTDASPVTTRRFLRLSTSVAPFPIVRVAEAQRNFRSAAIEQLTSTVSKDIADPHLAWLFANCFPNTLDTTVDFAVVNGKADTYVITGDISEMWLRDSSAQVWPYLSAMKDDTRLRQMIGGVIRRQTSNILLDPYANAFSKDTTEVSYWKQYDQTEMKPGVYERKWEVDSLCYPIRLAYGYWKNNGDTTVFDADWESAIAATLRTFREQQLKTGLSPYVFVRKPADAGPNWTYPPGTEYGPPVTPVGLIASRFRPSDDEVKYQFLIPSNYFAVASLHHAAEMIRSLRQNPTLASDCDALANEVSATLATYAITNNGTAGSIIAYETNGRGNYYFMDDANIPNLLGLPYLDAISATEPIYQRTRAFALGTTNPFYYVGTAAKGIGSPHTPADSIWPLGLIMQAMTSTDTNEIRNCLRMLRDTDGGTGFMHESFNKNDPKIFTRGYFAWANTLFGELILKVHTEHPEILSQPLN